MTNLNTYLPAKPVAFDPPTALALIARIEELEATIQRVRDLVDRLETGEHPLGRFIAKDIHQALGDTK